MDDDSQDGSERIAAELARRLPVRMEVRRDAPRDLSAAVLAGIRSARYHRVVVLDADLSHPPERIPRTCWRRWTAATATWWWGAATRPAAAWDRAWSPRRFPRFAARHPVGAPAGALLGSALGVLRRRSPQPAGATAAAAPGLQDRTGVDRAGKAPHPRSADRFSPSGGGGSSKLDWRQQIRFLAASAPSLPAPLRRPRAAGGFRPRRRQRVRGGPGRLSGPAGDRPGTPPGAVAVRRAGGRLEPAARVQTPVANPVRAVARETADGPARLPARRARGERRQLRRVDRFSSRPSIGSACSRSSAEWASAVSSNS